MYIVMLVMGYSIFSIEGVAGVLKVMMYVLVWLVSSFFFIKILTYLLRFLFQLRFRGSVQVLF